MSAVLLPSSFHRIFFQETRQADVLEKKKYIHDNCGLGGVQVTVKRGLCPSAHTARHCSNQRATRRRKMESLSHTRHCSRIRMQRSNRQEDIRSPGLPHLRVHSLSHGSLNGSFLQNASGCSRSSALPTPQPCDGHAHPWLPLSPTLKQRP